MQDENAPHILLIDDDDNVRIIASFNMENHFGYRITEAEDAERAQCFLLSGEDPPGAILVDFKMPGMNGIEFLSWLKNIAHLNIPTIMMTSADSTALAVEFMKMGGTDYIQKPILDYGTVDVMLRHSIAEAKARRQLREAEAKALAAEKTCTMMEEFVAKMSHELGTPSHHIASSINLIGRSLDNDDMEGARQWLETAHSSSARLRRLVNDIFDLSRIQRGKFSIRKRPADLSKLAKTAVEEASGNHPGFGGEFSIDAKPAKINCDPDRMVQVLVNLLNNAVCHAPQSGQISVHVEAKSGKATCRVSDQGPGIPDDKVDHIFEPFFQDDDAYNASGHLGLGLTISREIVRLHDGDIRAENGKDRGAVFSFEIPLESALKKGGSNAVN